MFDAGHSVRLPMSRVRFPLRERQRATTGSALTCDVRSGLSLCRSATARHARDVLPPRSQIPPPACPDGAHRCPDWPDPSEADRHFYLVSISQIYQNI